MSTLDIEQGPNRTPSISERLKRLLDNPILDYPRILGGIVFDRAAIFSGLENRTEPGTAKDPSKAPAVLKIPRALYVVASHALRAGQSAVDWVRILPPDSVPPAHPIDMPEPPDYNLSGARPGGTPLESEVMSADSAARLVHPSQGRNAQL